MTKLAKVLLPCAGRYAYDDGRPYTVRHKWYDRICYRLVLIMPMKFIFG